MGRQQVAADDLVHRRLNAIRVVRSERALHGGGVRTIGRGRPYCLAIAV